MTSTYYRTGGDLSGLLDHVSAWVSGTVGIHIRDEFPVQHSADTMPTVHVEAKTNAAKLGTARCDER